MSTASPAPEPARRQRPPSAHMLKLTLAKALSAAPAAASPSAPGLSPSPSSPNARAAFFTSMSPHALATAFQASPIAPADFSFWGSGSDAASLSGGVAVVASRPRSASPRGLSRPQTMADREQLAAHAQASKAVRETLRAQVQGGESSSSPLPLRSPLVSAPSALSGPGSGGGCSPGLRSGGGWGGISASASASASGAPISTVTYALPSTPKPSASLSTSGFLPKTLASPSAARESGHLPGYGGHVPGLDHVAGRSFAKATKRAMQRGPLDHARGESIPSPPQANSKIKSPDSAPGHIPGYAGHVQDFKNKFGGTFSALTSECPFADLRPYSGLRSKVGRKTLNAATK